MSRGEPITRFSTEVEDQQYKVVFLGGEEVNPENVVVIFGDTQRKWSDYSQIGSDIEPGDRVTLDNKISGDSQYLRLVYSGSDSDYSSIVFQQKLYPLTESDTISSFSASNPNSQDIYLVRFN